MSASHNATSDEKTALITVEGVNLTVTYSTETADPGCGIPEDEHPISSVTASSETNLLALFELGVGLPEIYKALNTEIEADKAYWETSAA